MQKLKQQSCLRYWMKMGSLTDCVLYSFENYINHLSKTCDSVWQTPINNLKDYNKDEWYKSELVGHNQLEKFMGNLSKMCGLSQHYTNHCIRVTVATNLCRQNYSAKQIMTVKVLIKTFHLTC